MRGRIEKMEHMIESLSETVQRIYFKMETQHLTY